MDEEIVADEFNIVNESNEESTLNRSFRYPSVYCSFSDNKSLSDQ